MPPRRQAVAPLCNFTILHKRSAFAICTMCWINISMPPAEAPRTYIHYSRWPLRKSFRDIVLRFTKRKLLRRVPVPDIETLLDWGTLDRYLQVNRLVSRLDSHPTEFYTSDIWESDRNLGRGKRSATKSSSLRRIVKRSGSLCWTASKSGGVVWQQTQQVYSATNSASASGPRCMATG